MRIRLRHNFKRLAQISFQNIGRNLLLSVATAVMMGLILFIFNVIMVLNVLTQATIEKIAEKVDLIVYLSDETLPYEIDRIVKDIESLPVVKSVQYTSKREALTEFLAEYPEKADPFTNYGIANPLPGNIKIVTEKPEEHAAVREHLEKASYARYLVDTESAGENQEIVERLISVTNFTQKLIFGVIITFIFGSLLIIINAIHLSIFTRKLEIQIMQLVGANPNIIRFPFIFEGMVYSLIAVFFSFSLLMVFLEGSHLTALANFNANFNPLLLFGLELAGSIAIGVLSSYIALNYYLKRTLILES